MPVNLVFDYLIRGFTTVRLPGGLIKTIIYLLIVLSLCITAISFIVRLWWFILIILLLLFALIFYALMKSFELAKHNPLVAIMDGAELIRYEETKQGKKGNKGKEILSVSPPTIDHEVPEMRDEEILASDSLPAPELEPPSALSERDK